MQDTVQMGVDIACVCLFAFQSALPVTPQLALSASLFHYLPTSLSLSQSVSLALTLCLWLAVILVPK